jgi:SAM-dependent methyltransferase
MGGCVSWQEFWDGETPIYANWRHKLLHYRLIASGIVGAIAELPRPTGESGALPVVLDHGCGQALSAEDVAARCKHLYLCEAAAGLRQKLAERYAAIPTIEIIGRLEVADLAEASLDLVVANSVVQYLTAPEFASLLRLWRHALKPQGALLVADVLPKGLSPLTDAMALLRFGWQGGFLFAAVAGLARTAFSDYRKLRGELGLASYDEKEMIALLAEAGFVAKRRYPNLGHNQARMAFLATPS